jgi:hypothetical protein
MADRNVANTATLDTLRTTYNSTAADVGDITSVTGASGVIASATDIVEAITLMNTEVTGIKTGATTFESQITFEGATDDAYETTLAVTDPTADRTITFADASGTLVVTDATQTLTNKTLTAPTITSGVFNTAISGSAFLDEDNLDSNSATKLASQQSIKAYVDAQITAQDLDFQGDSGGALSIDLDSETLTIAGGTGIDTTGSGNSLTIAVDSTVTTLTGSQTLTNKTLTSPTITSGVLNTAISGSAFLDEDNMASNSATKLASQQSIKAYVDATVAAEDLDIAADSGSNIDVALGTEVLTFTGGTGIDTSVSGTTVTVATDSTIVTKTGTQTLTNKTINGATFNSPTFNSLIATALNLTDSSIVFEGATADSNETTLTVVDPTADRTITIPNETGTLITSASAATNAFSVALAAALG